MFSICFLITALDPIGGAEMQVTNLAKALRSRGWKVTVISMLPEGHRLAGELRNSGVSIASLGMRKGIADPRAIWRLAKIITVLKPDVLHAHMVDANLLARITRLFAAVPLLISTAHNIREGGRLCDLLYRVTDPLGDLTTNVSDAAARRYRRDRLAPEARLRVVRNGIDVERFRPCPTTRAKMRRLLGVANEFVWLAIGQLREQKDYPNLLRAFAGLGGGRLLIAGEGGLRPQLVSLTVRLQIAERVRFCGFCENSAELLNAADGYVLSSRWEGLPLVLLEAAATALPIAATDVGGNSEIVLHGQSGFLVPAGDFVGLRRVMQNLMAMPEQERHAMGAIGREFVVTRYSMASIASEWECLYREFLSRRTSSRALAGVSAIQDP